MQSETCSVYIENKVYSQEFCASCWFIYILQNDARFILYQSDKQRLIEIANIQEELPCRLQRNWKPEIMNHSYYCHFPGLEFK